MNNKRLNKVLEIMKENNIYQMIISDKMSIYYLTGEKIESMERFIALYIDIDNTYKFIINRLFYMPNKNSLDYIIYEDNQDGVEILSNIVNKNYKLGIDKTLKAGFLIRLLKFIKIDFFDSSFVVDNLRLIKDEEEQMFLREVSRLNDIAMEKLYLGLVRDYLK